MFHGCACAGVEERHLNNCQPPTSAPQNFPPVLRMRSSDNVREALTEAHQFLLWDPLPTSGKPSQGGGLQLLLWDPLSTSEKPLQEGRQLPLWDLRQLYNLFTSREARGGLPALGIPLPNSLMTIASHIGSVLTHSRHKSLSPPAGTRHHRQLCHSSPEIRTLGRKTFRKTNRTKYYFFTLKY